MALGLGTMGWSVDECITRFEELCTEAFRRRRGTGLPLLGQMVENFHHSKYETTSLESALKKVFSEDKLLFGGCRSAGTRSQPVKVAVTSYSLTDHQAIVMANYNHPWGDHIEDGDSLGRYNTHSIPGPQ